MKELNSHEIEMVSGAGWLTDLVTKVFGAPPQNGNQIGNPIVSLLAIANTFLKKYFNFTL